MSGSRQLTQAEVRAMFPNASPGLLAVNAGTQKYEAKNRTEVSNAKPAKQAGALVGHHAGEAQSTGCPHVCFTLRRVRLLDVDAKYGSIKDLLDGLQYAGLIRGDREGEITLEVRQERVTSFKEEETVIEIDGEWRCM